MPGEVVMNEARRNVLEFVIIFRGVLPNFSQEFFDSYMQLFMTFLAMPGVFCFIFATASLIMTFCTAGLLLAFGGFCLIACAAALVSVLLITMMGLYVLALSLLGKNVNWASSPLWN